MKESDIRLALHHALQWRGYWPYHHQDARYCPRCHAIITPEVVGRPDTEARHPAFPTALIEVKAVKSTEKSFAFDAITPEQREYLSSWANEGGESYICLGKIVPMGSKEKIHQILVIPWLEWLEIEDAHDKSIPWDYGLYEKQPSLPRQNDLMSLIYPAWELVRNANDWHLQRGHPLSVCREVEVPFYKRNQEK
jgi:hypothetical protein